MELLVGKYHNTCYTPISSCRVLDQQRCLVLRSCVQRWSTGTTMRTETAWTYLAETKSLVNLCGSSQINKIYRMELLFQVRARFSDKQESMVSQFSRAARDRAHSLAYPCHPHHMSGHEAPADGRWWFLAWVVMRCVNRTCRTSSLLKYPR